MVNGISRSLDIFRYLEGTTIFLEVLYGELIGGCLLKRLF